MPSPTSSADASGAGASRGGLGSTSGLPAVSVVIPFHGGPEPVLALVDALRRDASPHLHEVIVSDDASPTPFPATDGVTVVRRERNGGFAAAVNTGAAVATGELLLVLNSDLEVAPGFLDALVGRAVPWMPALVTCDVVSPAGHRSWPGRHFPTTAHQVVEWLTPLARWRHLPALHEAVGHDTRTAHGRDTTVDWVMGALMLVPRAAWEAVGGLDEAFYMNCEEVDLQRRLRALGVPSVVLGGVTAVHEGGGSSGSDRRRGWLVDGRYRYARKWGGPAGAPALRLGLGAATGANLVWNGARRLAGAAVQPIQVARYETQLLLHPEQWVPEANRTRS